MPTATQNDKFSQLEAEADRLREAFELNQITVAQLEQGMKELMVQDEHGVWWTVGSKSREWFRYTGSEWVRGVPPKSVALKPPSPPVSAPASPATSRSSSQPNIYAVKPMKPTESSEPVSPTPSNENLQSTPGGSRGRFKRLCLAVFCAAVCSFPFVYEGLPDQDGSLLLIGIVFGVVILLVMLKAEFQRKEV